MKVCNLLILFTFFQYLFCDEELIDKLNNALDKSIPFFREFHPGALYFPHSQIFIKRILKYADLHKNNIIFSIDKSNSLFVKFVNLEVNISGKFVIDYFRRQNFIANLTDMTFSLIYKIKTFKKKDGKY